MNYAFVNPQTIVISKYAILSTLRDYDKQEIQNDTL